MLSLHVEAFLVRDSWDGHGATRSDHEALEAQAASAWDDAPDTGLSEMVLSRIRLHLNARRRAAEFDARQKWDGTESSRPAMSDAYRAARIAESSGCARAWSEHRRRLRDLHARTVRIEA